MKDILDFIGSHPVVTVIILVVIFGGLADIFRRRL